MVMMSPVEDTSIPFWEQHCHGKAERNIILHVILPAGHYMRVLRYYLPHSGDYYDGFLLRHRRHSKGLSIMQIPLYTFRAACLNRVDFNPEEGKICMEPDCDTLFG